MQNIRVPTYVKSPRPCELILEQIDIVDKGRGTFVGKFKRWLRNLLSRLCN